MKRKRRSAFVPRVIFGTVFVGVVPAVASCGGDDNASGQGGTVVMNSVAAAGFFGVGAGGFAGVGVGGFGGVAEGGFGGSGGSRDAATDTASTDATGDSRGSGGQDGGKRDAAIFGVAAGGFGVAKHAFEGLPSKASKANR